MSNSTPSDLDDGHADRTAALGHISDEGTGRPENVVAALGIGLIVTLIGVGLMLI